MQNTIRKEEAIYLNNLKAVNLKEQTNSMPIKNQVKRVEKKSNPGTSQGWKVG
jgi:hypothetical protein